MKLFRLVLFTMLLTAVFARADETVFQDDFKGHLGEGWSWIREHPDAWRVTQHGLEVRIEPGNMWGPANNAHNLLVRPAPDAEKQEVIVSVTFETHPTNQYEQSDLVWYFDDSNMVKIGRELVDGKVSVVMGREQADKTRTLAIIPIKTDAVTLQLSVKDNRIHGHYLTPDSTSWRDAGECDLPLRGNAKARISLQFYQGPADSEHWARVGKFRVRRVEN